MLKKEMAGFRIGYYSRLFETSCEKPSGAAKTAAFVFLLHNMSGHAIILSVV